ncbi:16S rRNA (adenine(1518)-N(6)/adenine(1519)-N(6))-dimethyltransferase RsmA [Crocosphaera chwakensis]|uniref:Ribosomal RNA small subunit methyltransferase A n=1 Tax=Crocosphaera chwakensis CCY0110 TaxID=391612 RepID=A3INV7_9CHRO|nr:16S rRNA (adenine(1518)-N(6)/adenine(1519)-N(6))-dimethyltransferase RsmA [Crocosphaera chwakensis]EAZ91759.1 dimethyladenosine transferase [Crocosphaera chwakensis CCY0110]
MPQPRKRFAQHWLRSETALEQIIQAANLKNSDRLLEIGPGTGILTRRLLPLVQSLIAVELDWDLCKKLVKSLGNEDNFLLLQGDILKLDIATEAEQFPKFLPINKVVANIPYNITSPILEKLLGNIASPENPPYDLIVLLIQKEVAQRIVASPGSKNYGALSIKMQYLADCNYICDVPKKSFYPPPKVDSAVITFRPRPLLNSAINPKQLETLINLGFSSRRKMLRNNLQSLIDRDLLTKFLTEIDLNEQVRAENLDLNQWIALSNHFSQ